MFQLKIAVLLLPILVLAFPAGAQILDDSTRQVYSVRTSRVFTEADILNGRYDFGNPDTTINNFHNERSWFADTAYYQFLDNLGSAAQPMLWQLLWQIGVRPGKTVFDLYAYEPARIRYFDTRSPFSMIRYSSGFRGNQKIDGSFARNISPTWNAGFDFTRFAADRQIAYTNRQDETQISGYSIGIHSNVRSKNERYRLLGTFTFFKNDVIENGGVRSEPRIFRDSLLDTRTELSWLRNASNLDQRYGIRLFQQYQLFGETLKFYHILDHRRQFNRFKDDELRFGEDTVGNMLGLLYYPVQFDTTSLPLITEKRTTIRQLENTFGIKGIRNHIGYGAFIKRRDAEVSGWWPELRRISQHFAGGDIRLTPLDSLHLTAFVEKQLDGEDYRAQVKLRYRYVELSQERLFAQPTLTEQEYNSTLFSWSNNFRNTTYDQTRATAFIKINPVRMRLRLEAKFVRYSNLIHFNQEARPQQFDFSGSLTQFSVSTYNAFGPIRFRNRVTYSTETSPQLLRVPELFYNGQLYFEGPLFKRALMGQIGFEGRYWSAYYPDAYMPATQQFFLQDFMQTQPYPVVDFFINADIKTVTVFLRMHNLAYGLTDYNYFYTPFYPGFTRSFMFGFRWMFFD